jgi:hypothetical protein
VVDVVVDLAVVVIVLLVIAAAARLALAVYVTDNVVRSISVPVENTCRNRLAWRITLQTLPML